jgi:ribosomal protein S18 acetylase RimI-like enzyme
MTARVTITRAAAADTPALAPLLAAYREFYAKPDGDAPRCEVFLRERLTRGESVVFMASVPGRGHAAPAGFAQLYPTFTSVGLARVWHLNDLFVSQTHRRAGIARALVLHCIAFARQDGAARLTLETQHHNAAARALYEKLGFVLGTEFVKYAALW